MVTNINVAVDDDLAERGREVKESHDWTWEQLFAEAIEEFDDGGE